MPSVAHPIVGCTYKGVPPVKAAYAAALRACAKGAEWERSTQLLDNYVKVKGGQVVPRGRGVTGTPTASGKLESGVRWSTL